MHPNESIWYQAKVVKVRVVVGERGIARMTTPTATDRLLGIVEAARILGVHRSTLHLAVREHQLVPDARTPHGHVRFRLETIEAFRARLTDMTGAGGSAVRLRTLTHIARLLAAGREREEICRSVLAAIRRLQPAVAIAYICSHAPTEQDPFELKVLASEGLSVDMIEAFSRLRPNHAFATTVALQTGKVELCDDASRGGLRPGSALLMQHMGMRSYAVVPILAEQRAIGVIALLSAKPQAFGSGEVAFMSVIADHLAAVLASAHWVARLSGMLESGRRLVQQALEARRGPASPGSAARALDDLVEAFRTASGASRVCVVGLGIDVRGEGSHLRELARQTREVGSMQLDIWRSGAALYTGIAACIPWAGGSWGAVAAAWRGQRLHWEEDHALLTIFGAACVLLTSQGDREAAGGEVES
jgi:GAF domain